MFLLFRPIDKPIQIELIIIRLISDQSLPESQTQRHLKELSLAQPGQFFITLAKIIQNTSACQHFDSLVQQKVSFNQQEMKILWHRVENDKKEMIKEFLLRPLLEERQSLARRASTCIVRIAFQQGTNQTCLHLLQLVRKSIHTCNQMYILNSAILLNEICLKIHDFHWSIPEEAYSVIVQVLLSHLERDGSQSELALYSIIVIYAKIKQNLEIDKNFDRLIKRIMILLDQRETRNAAYRLMDTLVQQSYCLLYRYIYMITQVTAKHIYEKNIQCIFALRLWQLISQTYLQKLKQPKSQLINSNRVQNYIILAQFSLLHQLLNYFQIQQDERVEISMIRGEVSNLLLLIAECGNQHTFNSILYAATSTLKHKVIDQQLEEQIQMLKCLRKFTPNQKLNNTALWWINELSNKFDSCPLKHQIYILTVFSQIAYIEPDIYLTSSSAQKLLSDLLKLAQSQDQTTRIKCLFILYEFRCLSDRGAISKLIESPNLESQLYNIFKMHIVQYLSEDVIQQYKELIQETLKFSQPQTVNQFLEFLIKQYLTQTQQHGYYLVTPIVNIITMCLFTLKNFPYRQTSNSKSVLDIIDMHLINFGAKSDSLSLIEGATICYPQNSKLYFDKYWSILQHVIISSTNDLKVFKHALNSIRNISHSEQIQISQLSHKISQVINALLDILQKVNTIEAKQTIIDCLSELGLGTQKVDSQLIGAIYSHVLRQLTLFQTVLNDKNGFEYYTSVFRLSFQLINCLRWSSKMGDGQLDQVFNFIRLSINKLYNPPLNYLAQIIEFLCSLLVLFGKQTLQGTKTMALLLQPSIRDIIHDISFSAEKDSSLNNVIKLVNFVMSGH